MSNSFISAAVSSPRTQSAFAGYPESWQDAAWLCALGYGEKEVSDWVGCEMGTALNLLAEPLLKEKAKKIKERFFSEKTALSFKQMVPVAIEVLKRILNDEKAKHSDRMAAANIFLERDLGKVRQAGEEAQTNTAMAAIQMATELIKQLGPSSPVSTGGGPLPSPIIDVTPKKDEITEWVEQFGSPESGAR